MIKKRQLFVACIAASAGVLIDSSALAQGSATSSDAIEEVVVTAQKREQNLQDVGISISAFTAENLRAMNVQQSSEIARLTPGVHIAGSNGGQTTNFTIRGVTQSDFAGGIEGPNAVYVDDTYVASLQGQLFGLFDLERVEVLKGPQGTLFGRNATGGLVHFVVAKPKNELGGFANVTYGSYNQARVETALNLPLNDRSAIRVSGYYNRHDPIFNNIFPGGLANIVPSGVVNPVCCQDVWNDDTAAGRLQWQLTPNDKLSMRLTGSIARQNLSGAPNTSIATVAVFDAQGRLVNAIYASPSETRTAIGPTGLNFTGIPGSPPGRLPGRDWLGYLAPSADSLNLSQDYSKKNQNNTRSYDIGLHVDYDFGASQLTAISSYKYFKRALAADAESGPVNFLVAAFDGKTTSFTQELRLAGKRDALTWTAGLFYLNINAVSNSALLAPRNAVFAGLFGAAATGVDLVSPATLKTNSYSAFGQIEYAVAPKWNLVFGARLIDEKKDYVFSSGAYANFDDYKIETTTFLFPVQASYSNKNSKFLWAAKAQAEYRPTDDWLVYFGVNRGVKGGAYNQKLPDGTPSLLPSQIAYAPETLWSYESGLKATLLDGHAVFNASAYYYDYKDYQAFVFQNVSGYVQNKDAKTYGVEAELSLRPSRGLRADVSLSAFHARVKSLEIAPGVPRDVEPPYAPKLQLAARISYQLSNEIMGGRVTLGADSNYVSSFFHNARNFDSTKFDAYALVNAHIGWKGADDKFELSVFANNIADKRYGVTGFEGSTIYGGNPFSVGTPRWFGITAGVRF